MKLEVIITIGMIITAAISLWAVVTDNHLFIG